MLTQFPVVTDNMLRVLMYLFNHPNESLSRYKIAQMVKLSRQTVANNVDTLTELGLLYRGEDSQVSLSPVLKNEGIRTLFTDILKQLGPLVMLEDQVSDTETVLNAIKSCLAILIIASNNNYLVKCDEVHSMDITYITERIMEDAIVAKPDLLEDGLEVIARQYEVQTGRIDILGRGKDNDLVVIELKMGRGSREALEQLHRYLDVIKEKLPENVNVRGIIGIEYGNEDLELASKSTKYRIDVKTFGHIPIPKSIKYCSSCRKLNPAPVLSCLRCNRSFERGQTVIDQASLDLSLYGSLSDR